MAKKEVKRDAPIFKNVAVLLEDHAKLAKLSRTEQRSMARQLSVLIRKAYLDEFKTDKLI